MIRIPFYLTLLVMLFGCKDKPKPAGETSTSQAETILENSDDDNVAKAMKRNYAVVWRWTTEDIEYAAKNAPAYSRELTKLWEDNIIENAYFDSEAPVDKLGNLPNITFFLRAASKTEAEEILNELTIVKLGVASYQLYPVGSLWLDRKTDVINEKGASKSFVTVWTTDKDPSNELVQKQHEAILALWNKGDIENVYFDTDTQNPDNEYSDFVFFVNAESREEAEAICTSLPFHQEDIAHYSMYQVGVFWMGRKK